MNTKRIAVDLDGTICENKKHGQEYIDVKPISGAVETIKELKGKGFYIIIFTARGQLTYSGDLEKRKKYTEPVIIEWLKKYDIPYDEIILTKPHVDYWIDDKNIEFKGSWEEIKNRLLGKED